MSRLLVVEDDENLRLTLLDNLELEGFDVQVAATVAEAEVLIGEVDLCILDIMLPDGNGYDFCQWVRNRDLNVLILMLTARTLDRDIDSGFESGADDYLVKPYRMRELLLRIKALLRRRAMPLSQQANTQINGFDICWPARQVNHQGNSVHLTKTEFDLLQYLYDNLDTVKSRDDILNAVWGESVYVDNRTVDNFVAGIKKHLNLKQGQPFYIRSVRGVGYCLQSKQ